MDGSKVELTFLNQRPMIYSGTQEFKNNLQDCFNELYMENVGGNNDS